jgi:hypothetical protein
MPKSKRLKWPTIVQARVNAPNRASPSVDSKGGKQINATTIGTKRPNKFHKEPVSKGSALIATSLATGLIGR